MIAAVQQRLAKLPPWLRPRGLRYPQLNSGEQTRLLGKRIFILPTKQGLFFIGLLGVMLIGASNYANNMAFALSFMLGSVMLVSIFHTYRNLVGLTLQTGQIDDCFAGEQAVFNLQLSNPSSRARFDIELTSPHVQGDRLDISAQGHNSATLLKPGPRRGRLPLGRLTLASRYPLGLFRAWAYVEVTAEALAYPRPAEGRAQPGHSQAAGDGVETAEPGNDDFHGFRSYQPGDSMRHINWKALARERGLFSKQFQRHQSPELWLDWEATRGDSEARLSQLCRWALDADGRQQRFGLRLPNVEIAVDEGPAHRRRCLRQLALFEVGR